MFNRIYYDKETMCPQIMFLADIPFFGCKKVQFAILFAMVPQIRLRHLYDSMQLNQNILQIKNQFCFK